LAKAKQGDAMGQALSRKGIKPPPTEPVAEPVTEHVPETSRGHMLAGTWTDPTVKRAGIVHLVRGETARRTAGGAVTATVTPSPDAGWAAMRGQDLRATIPHWAEAQGMRVLCRAGEPYAIRRSVNFQGPFSGALQRLLEQFAGEKQRP